MSNAARVKVYPNTTPRPTVQLVFSAGSGLEQFLSQYGQSAEAGGILVSGGKKNQDDESSTNGHDQLQLPPVYKVVMSNFTVGCVIKDENLKMSEK